MTQAPTGLPSPERLTELLADEFERAGYEIEDVTIDTRSRPPRIRIIADGDTPLDMDTVAELSRSASAMLDTIDTDGPAYVLEVSSPGVDRPLTAEKHFRRARGRKVDVELASPSANDATAVVGRVSAVGHGNVELVVRDRGGWALRSIPLADIRKAVVQVEFSPPSAKELEMIGDVTGTHGTEVGT